MVSTAQLSFSCPQPPARLGGAPARCGRWCRCPRAGRCGAERCPPGRCSAAVALRGRGAGAAGSAASGNAGPPPHRNFCWRVGARCRAAGRAERGAGAAPGAARCGAVRRGACRLLHFASFTCFTEVAPAPAAAPAPLSRPRRGEPGTPLPPSVLPGSAAPAGRGSGARSGLAVRGCGGEVYGGFEMILPLYLL